MTTGYISIGSNIEKEIHIPASLESLRDLFGELTISSFYETAAVGFVGDAFHNLIVKFQSDLSAREVVELLRQIELYHGRDRQSPKFSARTLDLDLILYGDQIIEDDDLRLPRDEIDRYAFVLEPLAEIANNELHPIRKQSFGTIWRQFDKKGLSQKKVLPV